MLLLHMMKRYLFPRFFTCRLRCMLFNMGVIVLQNITIQPGMSGYDGSAVLNHLLIISSVTSPERQTCNPERKPVRSNFQNCMCFVHWNTFPCTVAYRPCEAYLQHLIINIQRCTNYCILCWQDSNDYTEC